ncbi:MAG TPA: CAP domain-containing protein [Solirubrobacterales bacterium]|nr:CAP domain-containing protein [Solirubrobacterales bacterium]
MARKAVTSVLLALCTAIGLLIGGGGTAPAMASNCQNTHTTAIDQALEDFDASVFCLINEQRAVHGRSALRPNGRLRRAAYDYATSMELGGFFSHYGDFFGHPAGATPISRLRQIGYIRRHNVWIVGENLHWTTADRSTPADVLEAWMNSPEHRKCLLKPRFRDLGIAAVRGIPSDPSETDGITVASELGFRDS